MNIVNWAKEMWCVLPDGNVACKGGWTIIEICTSVKDRRPRAHLVAAAPKLYHALERAELGYKVFKTMLNKAGLMGGYETACEHLKEFEAVLKEARGQ